MGEGMGTIIEWFCFSYFSPVTHYHNSLKGSVIKGLKIVVRFQQFTPLQFSSIQLKLFIYHMLHQGCLSVLHRNKEPDPDPETPFYQKETLSRARLMWGELSCWWLDGDRRGGRGRPGGRLKGREAIPDVQNKQHSPLWIWGHLFWQ